MATMSTTITNFATNPRPGTALDSGAGAWSYVAGTGELGTSAPNAGTGPLGLPGFARRTITTAKSSGLSGWLYSEESAGNAGNVRDVALYLRPPATVDVIVRVQFLLGGVDAGTASSISATIPAGAWTQVFGLGGSESSFDEVRVWAHTASPVPAGTFDAACIFLDPGEVTPSSDPYPSVFLFPSETIFPL